MFQQASLDEMGFILRNKQKYPGHDKEVIKELKSRTKNKNIARTILEFEMKDYIETPEEINLNRLYAMTCVYQAFA